MFAAKNITTMKPDQFWMANRKTMMKTGMRTPLWQVLVGANTTCRRLCEGFASPCSSIPGRPPLPRTPCLSEPSAPPPPPSRTLPPRASATPAPCPPGCRGPAHQRVRKWNRVTFRTSQPGDSGMRKTRTAMARGTVRHTQATTWEGDLQTHGTTGSYLPLKQGAQDIDHQDAQGDHQDATGCHRACYTLL